MITSAPLWSVLVVPVLLAAFTAVAGGGGCAAGGPRRRPPAVDGRGGAPLAEVPRLAGRPAADHAGAWNRLLWRLGLATVPVAGGCTVRGW